VLRKHHLTPGLQKALKKLEGGTPVKRSAGAQELVRQLVLLGASKKKIAAGFSISLPTLYRWLNAQFSPRDMSRVRAALNHPDFLNQLLNPENAEKSWHPPELHSMDRFFNMAIHAKRVFKIKGFVEFQVSESRQVQSQMKQLLERNQKLKIYYVFPCHSRAEETFCPFFELLKTIGPEWSSRIKPCQVEDDAGLLALGLGYAGVIIIDYDDPARKQFNRLVDVLLEVPVRTYENGEPNPFLKKKAFLELQTEVAHDLWMKWSKFFVDRGIIEPPHPHPFLVNEPPDALVERKLST